MKPHWLHVVLLEPQLCLAPDPIHSHMKGRRWLGQAGSRRGVATRLIEQMARALKRPVDRTEELVRMAPTRYRTYTIPKKEPGKTRLIAEPPREIKALQRWFAETHLSRLPLHRAATAYRPGSSIVKNASAHQASAFLLTMDFEDFFPSLRPRDLRHAIARSGTLSFSSAELKQLDNLLFWKPAGLAGLTGLRLSSGAPSSPAISNIVLYELDQLISDICRKKRVRYTRYADDLTFSARSEKALLETFAEVGRLIRKTRMPRLRVNADKTVFSSRSSRREVTGLTLTPQGHLSIGRDRKSQIRDQIDRFRRGRLDGPASRKLAGLIAFARDVEPGFVDRLTRKHGDDLIGRIGVEKKPVRNRRSQASGQSGRADRRPRKALRR